MRESGLRWLPSTVLLLGALCTVWADPQQSLPLRQPLTTALPTAFGVYTSRSMLMSDAERRATGVSDYLLREYRVGDTSAFTLYVGYYARQARGTTIHSPKNCLPGAGWEPLASATADLSTSAGIVTVNRYVLQRGAARVLVLYWYQGRGRVSANEYWVKWELLRDAAVRQRSDEALVRIVVPITESDTAAFAIARGVAARVIPELKEALPS
jgi:EpsI family protein